MDKNHLKDNERDGRNSAEVICPYCGKPSKKVHSRYERSFQASPIQGKKTTIVGIRRKIFCENKECKKKRSLNFLTL